MTETKDLEIPDTYAIADIVKIAIKNEDKLSNEAMLNHLEQFCTRNQIRMSRGYKLIDDVKQYNRIILSGNVSNAGTVICTDTWKILAMPPSQPTTKFSRREVDSNLEKYEVTKIIDGTIATLYYYGGSWCISTTNGFDVGDITWIGEKTFSELVYDALSGHTKFAQASGIGLNGHCRLELPKLSTDYYYTIGFRHEDIHPPHARMKCPKRLAWFVGSNCPDADNPMTCLPVQAIVNTEKITKIDDLWTKAPSDYGYILRRKGEVLLVESDLTRDLKKYVYNIPKLNGLDCDNRMMFVIIRAFLSDTCKDKFIALFPQFATEYKKCGIIYKAIVTSIANLAAGRKVSSTFGEFAEVVYNKMRKIDAINSTSQNWKIIDSFIGPKYTMQFMKLYDEKFE